jgi:chromosome segregation ATPase
MINNDIDTIQRIIGSMDVFKSYRVHYLKDGRPTTKTFNIRDYISELTAYKKAVEFNNKVNKAEQDTIDDLSQDVDTLTIENKSLEKELDEVERKVNSEIKTLHEMNRQLGVKNAKLKDDNQKLSISKNKESLELVLSLRKQVGRLNSKVGDQDTLINNLKEGNSVLKQKHKGDLQVLTDELNAFKKKMSEPTNNEIILAPNTKIQDLLIIDTNGKQTRLDDPSIDKVFIVVNNKIQTLK